MLVLRENPRSDRSRGRQSSVLRTLDSTMAPHSKEHKFCHDIAFMVIGRINDRLETQLTDDFAQVTFHDILKAPAIEKRWWHEVDATVCAIVTRIHETAGAPPLNYTFDVVDKHSLRLTLRDARAVDRRSSCRTVAAMMLLKDFLPLPLGDAYVRNILAQMVWATRLDPGWDVNAQRKKRPRTEAGVKYTDRMMDVAEEREWDFNHCNADEEDEEEDDEGNGGEEQDSDEYDEESDSFSLHDESSSSGTDAEGTSN